MVVVNQSTAFPVPLPKAVEIGIELACLPIPPTVCIVQVVITNRRDNSHTGTALVVIHIPVFDETFYAVGI